MYIDTIKHYINSYLKPSNTEKRLLGEVFTPLYGKSGCVEDQLNLMDESFWKRKDVKVLDPCSGIGNYSVVLVDKFMKGLVDEIPDSEERLKWILEEIIYINEYQSKNLFIYLQLFDSENKYKMNFNKGDYLKLDIKKTFGVEKFDLICMNPPYQEMDGGNGSSAMPLYNKFIEKSIKESDKVISINPSRWFAGGKGLDSFRNKMKSSKKVKQINHFDNASDIFGNGVEIKGGISFMLIDNDYMGNCNFNGIETDINSKDIILTNPFFIKISDKFEKLIGVDTICDGSNLFGIDYRSGNDTRIVDKKENSDYVKVYTSKPKGFEKFINKNLIKTKNEHWRVATPRAATKGGGGFGNIFIVSKDEYTSDAYITFKVNSESEAKSLHSYLHTSMANFLLGLRKISQDLKPDTCKWIPLVPFDREWTDELLFDYFNLSEEEKNIVLNYDKK